MNEHRPVGPVEASLVQQLALAHFRIIRLNGLIAEAFDRIPEGISKEIVDLDRMINSANRSFSRALEDLRRLQKDPVNPAAPYEDTIADESSEPPPPPAPGWGFDPRRATEESREQTQFAAASAAHSAGAQMSTSVS